jgi:putative colanic acid biosynthesis UDP-glucose lipid carrier transferase
MAGVSKLLDAASIALCLAIPTMILTGDLPTQYLLAIMVALIVYSSIGSMDNMYRPWHGELVIPKYSPVRTAWSVTVFTLLGAGYFSNTFGYYSQTAITIWIFSTPVALLGWRSIARSAFIRIVKKPEYQKKAVVWGRGATAEQLVRTITESPHLGLKLIDHVVISERDTDRRACDDSAMVTTARTDDQQDSIFEDLVIRAKRCDFNILYIARQGFSSERLADFVERLADTAVSVYLVPDFSSIDLFQGHWSSLEGIPLISVFDTPFLGVDGLLKRIADIILSILILTIVGIPMLLIALLIGLTSGRPILFRQDRYGIGGQRITVLKFRTMSVCENGADIVQARPNDPRVTRLGRFLRRTSLDELPQFLNALSGEMSIVGPRPHAVSHNEFYRRSIRGYMLRHKVKPGITGWAQVNGWRGETDDLYKMEKRIEYDLWYIRNWSLWLDIHIIFLTIFLMFKGKNAY